MMTSLSCKVIAALEGRTLATAESCTGGGIGYALTAVPGSSAVYKGGIIAYTNEVKVSQLGVSTELLDREGAVSGSVAAMMAVGARTHLNADIAISVTGLAGPGGDEYGNEVGTVYIGYSSDLVTNVKKFVFSGDRITVRKQAIDAALNLVLEYENEREL